MAGGRFLRKATTSRQFSFPLIEPEQGVVADRDADQCATCQDAPENRGQGKRRYYYRDRHDGRNCERQFW